MYSRLLKGLRGLFSPQGCESSLLTLCVAGGSAKRTQFAAALLPIFCLTPAAALGQTYSLSGAISGSAATVTLSGPKSAVATIAAGGTYQFSGLADGTYVVAASEPGYSFSPGTASVSIKGANVTGVNFSATPAPTVSLSWAASGSANIAGYDVYRSGTSGGPYTLLNSSLVPDTSYVDATVKAGQTYYYVTTAVNSGNDQSSYSNQAVANVAASGSSAAQPAATWTIIQHPGNYTCTGTNTTTVNCTVKTAATTAGNLLILMSSIYSKGSSGPVVSSASGGGTWTHCPNGAASVSYSSGSWNAVDCGYILSASGGATSVTLSWTGSFTAANVDLELVEVHRSTGTATYDNGNLAETASCASCSAPALSLTGSSDFIMQFGSFAAVPTAISGGYSADFDQSNVQGGWAAIWNVSSYAAPVWTQNQAAPFAGGVVAFK